MSAEAAAAWQNAWSLVKSIGKKGKSVESVAELTGLGLAPIKQEGMCLSVEHSVTWDPRDKEKANYIASIPKYRRSSASKAWDEALKYNAIAQKVANDDVYRFDMVDLLLFNK